MNAKKFMFVAVIIGLITMSCNQNEDILDQKGDPASMQITLKTSNPGLRSTGLPTQALENKINSFTVYVYDGVTNLLEKSQTFTPATAADYTQTLTGLITGQKKVAVIANEPTAYSALNKTNYANLATNMFDLSTQTASNNLAMSGEAEITLTTAANPLSISISRVVAKVQLGTITVTPDAGHTGTLVLTKAHIMKATGTVSMGLPSMALGTNYYGGTLGTVSLTTQTFLSEDITVAVNPTTNPIYFYVFPNLNTGHDATLLTLEGTYNGTKTYFPFIINYSGDSFYLSRNSYITVNVTIKRAGSGSTDPETPVDPATMQVTITPLDWFIETPQNVTW